MKQAPPRFGGPAAGGGFGVALPEVNVAAAWGAVVPAGGSPSGGWNPQQASQGIGFGSPNPFQVPAGLSQPQLGLSQPQLYPGPGAGALVALGGGYGGAGGGFPQFNPTIGQKRTLSVLAKEQAAVNQGLFQQLQVQGQALGHLSNLVGSALEAMNKKPRN